MADKKKKLTTKDFGIELSKAPKNKQEQLEKSLGVLIQAAKETIQESKN